MSLFDLSLYQQARISAIAKSFNQEVAADLLEKGKVAQPIGTIKEMGGKTYEKIEKRLEANRSNSKRW